MRFPPKLRVLGPTRRDYSKDLRPAEWGSLVILRGNNPQNRMSALGQKRTLKRVRAMSALLLQADITGMIP
jgi:hypothetical protein